MPLIEKVGMLAALILPLWNIPLIIKIRKRKSSQDMSLSWALGVFGCLLAMLPAGLVSPDPVFRLFTIVNVCLFATVVYHVIRYR